MRATGGRPRVSLVFRGTWIGDRLWGNCQTRGNYLTSDAVSQLKHKALCSFVTRHPIAHTKPEMLLRPCVTPDAYLVCFLHLLDPTTPPSVQLSP